MKKRFAAVIAIALCVTFALAACGGPAGSGGAAPDYIKIGVPTPITGQISGFGVGTEFVQKLVTDTVNANGGIYIKDYDKKIPIKILMADSQSDPNKAGEIAEQMATKDGVNMFVAQHTPDNTIPVALCGEKHGIPTVANGCPKEPLMGAGPFKWVFYGFWGTTDVMDVFISMWKDLGYGPGTKVGLLLPNDADALAWKEAILQRVNAEGFIPIDSGGYEMGNKEWTNIINTFKQGGVQIICGNDIAPNFQSFIEQAQQQNLKYDLISMGRAFLFPQDANALPISVSNGLTNETWWAPSLPFKSSLDGMTPRELCDKWMASGEKGSEDWYATLGDKYSALEIAIDALTRAQSLDPAKIQEALAATDLDTIGAHIKYSLEPDGITHTCVTPIAGGQWRTNQDGKTVSVHIVNTGTFPASVQPEMPIALPKDLQ